MQSVNYIKTFKMFKSLSLYKSILVPTTGNAADPAAAADCSSGQTAATTTFK